MSELHLYDFGIFIELQPDEEEKQLLENNIQIALQQQSIELEDAIDIRNVRNLKLANQFLKLRRKKKAEKDQKIQESNIEKQGQANQQAAQAAAQAEMQKNQQSSQVAMQLEQMKSDLKLKEQASEVELKKQLMAVEFDYSMKLKQLETEAGSKAEKEREDRKDNRTKIQATQQSEMIEQRNSGGTPKNFESAGNDILSGGFNLNAFDPK